MRRAVKLAFILGLPKIQLPHCHNDQFATYPDKQNLKPCSLVIQTVCRPSLETDIFFPKEIPELKFDRTCSITIFCTRRITHIADGTLCESSSVILLQQNKIKTKTGRDVISLKIGRKKNITIIRTDFIIIVWYTEF